MIEYDYLASPKVVVCAVGRSYNDDIEIDRLKEIIRDEYLWNWKTDLLALSICLKVGIIPLHVIFDNSIPTTQMIEAFNSLGFDTVPAFADLKKPLLKYIEENYG